MFHIEIYYGFNKDIFYRTFAIKEFPSYLQWLVYFTILKALNKFMKLQSGFVMLFGIRNCLVTKTIAVLTV